MTYDYVGITVQNDNCYDFSKLVWQMMK